MDEEFQDGAWIGTPSTCEILAITPRDVYRPVDRGVLPAYKFGRVIRLRLSDVEHFARRRGG